MKKLPPLLSIIIPVLDEAPIVVRSLSALQGLRENGHELILVDGGSRDGTVALSEPFVDRILRNSRGRGRQMNAGARAAGGEILLFLHIDTSLPGDADRLIIDGLKRKGKRWGRFDVRLSGRHPLLRIIERLMNWRSRLTGIATGDQAIFARRELFEAVGGFPDIDLMEDVALSRLFRRHGPPLCLSTVTTSSRRWEKNGILRTILLMWNLRLAFFLGVDPQVLRRIYEGERWPRK